MKSFRVTRDRAGRWHVSFAQVPDPIPAPGNGAAVGVGARESDRRRDRADKTTTRLVADFDVIAVEVPGASMVPRAERVMPRTFRLSQAVFRCVACGHRANADVHAARNIEDTAAGRAVAARGALQPPGGAMNREPQPDLHPA
ncbi:transposase [Actinomadura madurae]|uniref:transposase n=1 Tax=Actinomadura madurae TaxID=1993 RepID=UPI0020269104|nr:transposase [Actinomadura madurae]MCP9951537.1 transposase [Actinomadura madurae]MCP9968311.1 transposase [Actinomadura madurae]MCP9980775.1 transposase [Actinomadura madurae]MCQ0007726.1 transposase [Actinomadura madurae]MCQ0016969.1 transposase [Actinomadura madurae]